MVARHVLVSAEAAPECLAAEVIHAVVITLRW